MTSSSRDVTADAMHQALAHLLPEGYAWPRHADAVWMRVLAGLALAFEELHAYTLQSAREWLPTVTQARLLEWEDATGLPDPCIGADQSTELRRAAVLARLRGYRGPYDDSSPAALGVIAAYCAALGFGVTLLFNQPFRVGRNRVGDRLGRLDGVLRVLVAAPASRALFRVGQNRVGDRLAEPLPGASELQCVLERVVPARFNVSIVLI